VVVPLSGGEKTSILAGAEVPFDFDVSPDGRWIAYESRETGRHEVFVHSFPGGAAKLQLSTDGGDAPRWSDRGRKLVYRTDKVFREVSLDLSGAAPRVVRTDTLFRMRDRDERPVSSYSVSPDGKHFVVARPLGQATRLVVVQNWITEVRAKLAGR
jgi:hypothetical protein